MAIIDVFNGDADGICALVQWRLAAPAASQLVTGVKRDIALLDRIVEAKNSQITVLDIALEKNYSALLRLLPNNTVFYCDHHKPGKIPQHKNLQTLINTHADVCTSLLINGYLQGQFALWAMVGALGDNLDDSAKRLAKQQGLNEAQFAALKHLGQLANYNAYGEQLSDLLLAPEQVFQTFVSYANPLHCIEQESALIGQLDDGFQSDLAQAENLSAYVENAVMAVFILPDRPWARRVSGTWANQLVYQSPDRAHAILTDTAQGYTVSLRAPLNNKQGAADVCGQFATGGGREAAAGIQRLAKNELEAFIQAVYQRYAG